MAENELVELQIDRLVYGGDAMGRLPDGRAAFLPFALPGEKVLAQIVEEKRGHVRAVPIKILSASPERIQPRCRHFQTCGGCHYQHMPYDMQLRVKESVLREQLERIAGIASPPLKAIIPSPQPWNYRNFVQFHLAPEGRLGFNSAGSNRVVAVEECFLPLDALNEVWPNLDLEPVPDLTRVSLRAGAEDDIQLILESQSDLPEMEFELDMPISAVHLGRGVPLLLAGDPFVLMQVKEQVFKVSAGSFFQVNTAQAAAMVDEVLSLLPLNGSETLLDVYSGVGLFSAFLAPRVNRLIAVESSAAACDDFVANLDAFDNVELYMGAAEDILNHLPVKPDAVLLDPPRAGLAKPALDALVKMQPGKIVYVSCDPATLARDLKRLISAGYRLDSCRPVDMFPQTYHVETVALLSI